MIYSHQIVNTAKSAAKVLVGRFFVQNKRGLVHNVVFKFWIEEEAFCQHCSEAKCFRASTRHSCRNG